LYISGYYLKIGNSKNVTFLGSNEEEMRWNRVKNGTNSRYDSDGSVM
jgi:hypothetical protein